MGLVISASLGIRAIETVSSDLSSARDLLNLALTWDFSDGTGNNQCDKIFHDERTLSGGFTDDLDLSGVLVGKLSSTPISFAKVKLILVVNKSATLTLAVGGAASAQFAPLFGAVADFYNILPSGASFLVAPLAGYAVTNTSADLLRVASSAGATYDIVLAGSTA
jgi:hypothetical protein